MDNLARQREEVEVMGSIYGDEWRMEDETNTSFSVCLSKGNCEVVLYIQLPPAYPSEAPPLYQISAPALSRDEKQMLASKLENVYCDNLGECVIYQWVEEIKDLLHHKTHQIKENQPTEFNSAVPLKLDTNNELHIIHGDVITDRKSCFQGHAAVITSVDQVKQMLSILLDNKKINQATHNIYAYRFCKDNPAIVVQDCFDDGEKAAGGRLLHLLQMTKSINVMVVVSRWYGGIHLGPDRFKHINSAARQVLELSGIIKT